MVALPSGTVTFLFTDVEGSTRLMEQYPEPYRQAIGRHLAIVSQAIAGNGGAVFETLGDAVYSAFASPRDAVGAALAAQLGLREVSWGEIGALRVRMALHTGEVEQVGAHYFGPALYRCGRLANAAHGGQVLLSSTTAELVRETLADGVGLRELGEHRLKDLRRPERIFQLVAPGLAEDFPALRTLESFPNNLPVQPTAFIGRDREVTAVRGMLRLSDTRVLTLIGPGGVGKTRISLQVAADSLREFPDGTFFVDLAPIISADLVVPSIAKTLHVEEATNRTVLDSLREHLHDRQLLLVLDDFEHVLAAAAQVADLLAACPRVKALVTSREALHLRGERQFPVPPLALPDRSRAESIEQLTRYEAIRLFIDRAQAAKPDFAISERNAYAIAEICHRLDGLPLGIELAAARVSAFSPQALLARLEHRLAVLAGGPRDVPARQQTLRQAIAWSYDLLTPGEQLMYRRLAVFVGGCTPAAADAVVGAGRLDPQMDVVDTMASLMDKSLLRQEERAGELRYVARARTEESLVVWRELGDRQNTANALSTAGRLARDEGDYAAAGACLAESLETFKELGDRRGIAFALEGFAGLAADQAESLRAHCLVAAAATLRRIIGASPPPAWRADLERSLQAASRGLSRDALAEAETRGRSMTLVDAIAFAQQAPPPPHARDAASPR